MIVDQDKSFLNITYTDVDGSSTSKYVELPWDTNWIQIINHVGYLLEGAGFVDVRKRILVANFDHVIDTAEPEFVPLIDAVDY